MTTKQRVAAIIATPFVIFGTLVVIELPDFLADQESRQNIERGIEFRSGQ